MEYPMMEPPFPVKEFHEMSKKEAQVNFDWYLGQFPSRIQLLRDAFAFDGGNPDLLDLTPESLKAIWAWFVPQVKTVPKTQEELEAERKTYPDWLLKTQPPSTEKLSLDTLKVAMDIAIYFAEVLIRHNGNLKWKLVTRPRNDANYHRPVLAGFGKAELNPSKVLHVRTSHVVDGDTSPDGLFNLYHVWVGYIPR